MTTAAVVLAGGSGRRAALGHNKALEDIAGRPVLAWAVDAVRDVVDRVVVVARPADRERLLAVLGDRVDAVVDGGPTRHASERAGLAAVAGADVTAFHDAARPCVSRALVRRVVTAAADGAAVVPGLPRPVPLAVWPAEEEGSVLHDALLIDRSRLMGVQTPQAAPTEVLRAAFAAVDGDPGGLPTDTVEPVLRHLPEVAVLAVPGEARNVKLTWRNDVDRVRELLEDPTATPPLARLRHRPGFPTGGPPGADLEVDGVTPVTDSLRVVRDGRVERTVDRRGLVDVAGDLLARDGVLPADVEDLGTAVEQAVLGGAILRVRRRR